MVVASVVDDNLEFAIQLNEIEKTYSSLLNGDISLDSLEESAAVIQITDALDAKKSELGARSKTSKLWLGYDPQRNLPPSFILSECTTRSWFGWGWMGTFILWTGAGDLKTVDTYPS